MNCGTIFNIAKTADELPRSYIINNLSDHYIIHKNCQKTISLNLWKLDFIKGKFTSNISNTSQVR